MALDAWMIFPGILPMLLQHVCLFLSALCHIMSEQWAHPNEPIMANATPFSHIGALGWVSNILCWQQRSAPSPALGLPGTLREVARPLVPQLLASGGSSGGTCWRPTSQTPRKSCSKPSCGHEGVSYVFTVV